MSDLAVRAQELQHSVTLLEIIRATIANPDVDVNKLRVVMEMQERAEERDAERQFARALEALQMTLPRLVKDGVIDLGKGKIPFATFESVMELVGPRLQDHGFTSSYTSTDSEATGVVITLTIRHSAGHSKTSTMRLPPDTGPGRNALQAIGSSRSYAKRYLMLDFVNVVTVNEIRDHDNDGNGATPTITREQENELASLLISTGVEKGAILAWAKRKSLAEIPAHGFDATKAAIRAKAGHKK